MYSAGYTNQFKKDYKLCVKRGYPMKGFQKIVEDLLAGVPLAPKCKLHSLTGNWVDFEECHIKPDWLLIFKREEQVKTLVFTRTGTHSDLFG